MTEPRYLDGSDHSVALFIGAGTNDGPLGPLPATGRRATFPLCEILTYDGQGRITGGEIYYDQLGILVQLGHAQAPPSA